MNFVGTALKAFYAAATAFLTGLGAVLVDGTNISDVTTSQWLTIATLTLAAFAAVYGVRNSQP